MASWFQRTGSEVLGWILVVVGLALLILPGPGMLALVAGVALLAPHYAWARRILDPLHEEGRLVEIRNLVEKPSVEDAPSDLAVLGRYVLTPKIFDVLEQTSRGAGGEIQLTDAIRTLIGEQPVFGYQFEGTRHDAGTRLGWLKANVAVALESEDADEFRAYIRGLDLRD